MALFQGEKHAVKTAPQDGEGGNDDITNKQKVSERIRERTKQDVAMLVFLARFATY